MSTKERLERKKYIGELSFESVNACGRKIEVLTKPRLQVRLRQRYCTV